MMVAEGIEEETLPTSLQPIADIDPADTEGLEAAIKEYIGPFARRLGAALAERYQSGDLSGGQVPEVFGKLFDASKSVELPEPAKAAIWALTELAGGYDGTVLHDAVIELRERMQPPAH